MELQSIWFFLWGLLWAVFFVTDGFDFGVGTLLPFFGKTEEEKKIIMASVGPLWDGNEVWLITAGGVTFAAFPKVYAVMFSTLYTPLMLILFALIIRGVSFEFRNQIQSRQWKNFWDGCFFIGSIAPAILFGVAFGNIFQGIPFDLNGVLHGNLFTFLNPYALLAGILFLALFLQHGNLWLNIKTEGELNERAQNFAGKIWIAVLVLAVAFLVASYFATNLYANYLKWPALFLIIIFTVVSLVLVRFYIAKKAYFKAWFASSGTIIGATFFGVTGLFPVMFPSSIDSNLHLTAFNASSSPLTLKIMLGVTLVFIPIVIVYQAYTYKLFSGKVTDDEANHGY
ncbi:MAG: cytochrome d ubiquinol oxidase subunit II [Desulfobacterales bacterium]|nr:cytochrome d ubiquinol oxidase subunit II [Desulfobacterales bacterium]